MKLLIVLALIAAAFADDLHVVPLPNEGQQTRLTAGISMDNLLVLKEVIDAVKAGISIARDAPVADEGLEVRFADALLQIADSVIVTELRNAPVADEGLEVRFADAPLQLADSVIVANLRNAPVADEGLKVRFADAPLQVADSAILADIPQEFSAPEPVRIAEPSLPEVAADAPLEGPQPVRLPEAPLPAYETAPAVEPVIVAMPQYRDYRAKHFANPLMR